MPIADMHCDTITEIYERRSRKEACTILENDLHVDLEKLKKGGYLLQNFAVFAHKQELEGKMGLPEYAFRVIDLFLSEMRTYEDRIGIVKSYSDIENNRKAGRLSAMLTMEEGAIFEGKLEYLRIFYELGVRMATFTWNFPNELAFPNRVALTGPSAGQFTPETERGLTRKGFEFLEEMERIGMIPDVSHLGDKGILDVIAHGRKPFVASHSNARAVCGHARNLTDEMIRGIAAKGGVIGVNLCPAFLRDEKKQGDSQNITFDDVICHIRHMIRIGGEDCVGLGTDFDGIPFSPAAKDASEMEFLEDRLREGGISQRVMEKVLCGNVLRIYRELL